MNFQEAQARNRRASQSLLFFFGLCVLATATITGWAVALLIWFSQMGLRRPYVPILELFFDPLFQTIFLYSAGAIGGFITILAIIRSGSHLNGGVSIAQSFGAQSPSDEIPSHKEFKNIVEEVSIAAGSVVPLPYVLEDPSINAFTAGQEVDDAVICITQGALDKLNREEVQAVVAHEMGHILEGDVRVNTRLIGLIGGLAGLSEFGLGIIRAMGRTRSSRSSRNSGNAFLFLFLFGIIFWILGWVGSVFAQLLQSAFSRKREFLADAVAVKLLRQTSGLSSLFKKLLVLNTPQDLASARSREIAHMLFLPAFRGLFATHPDLITRIQAVDQTFKLHEFQLNEAPQLRALLAKLPSPSDSPAPPQHSHPISESVLELVQSPIFCTAVLLGSTIARDEVLRVKQRELIEKEMGDNYRIPLDVLLKRTDELSQMDRIDALELALSRLQSLPNDKKVELIDLAGRSLKQNSSVGLLQWLSYLLIKRRLEPVTKSQALARDLPSLGTHEADIQILSDLMEIAGGNRSKQTPKAEQILKAAEKLRKAHPHTRAEAIKRLYSIAMADGVMTSNETVLERLLREILR